MSTHTRGCARADGVCDGCYVVCSRRQSRVDLCRQMRQIEPGCVCVCFGTIVIAEFLLRVTIPVPIVEAELPAGEAQRLRLEILGSIK